MMRIFIVEDEPLALSSMAEMVRNNCPTAEIHLLRNGMETVNLAKKLTPDIVFLDIEMPEMNGMDAAKQLRGISPRVNIIFTTGYSEYMISAFKVHASGYLVKPVTEEQVKQELDNLLWPPIQDEPKIVVTTFGRFSVFIDGHPVRFQYQKTEEMFAYLVNAGGRLCTNDELADVLWGDDSMGTHKSYLRNLIWDLRNVLRQHQCEDVLLRSKGQIGVDTAKIECDYYRWRKGDPEAQKAFHNEYMSQYSWPEVTLAWMINHAQTNKKEDE